MGVFLANYPVGSAQVCNVFPPVTAHAECKRIIALYIHVLTLHLLQSM